MAPSEPVLDFLLACIVSCKRESGGQFSKRQTEHSTRRRSRLSLLTDHVVVLDLKDVKLVDRDAVTFLAGCEADGAQIRNCPAYIREWIARERDGSSPHWSL